VQHPFDQAFDPDLKLTIALMTAWIEQAALSAQPPSSWKIFCVLGHR